MKTHKKGNKNGFTLIEVLVTIALIAIIIPVLYNFISFGNTIFSKGTAKAESQNDVNLIAFKISNQLRTVSDISLTAKTGYTEYNVKTNHPDLDSIVYTLSKANDTYLLNFTISESGHQVVSEIALNNVDLATTGSVNDKIWVLFTEGVSLKPTIVLGNASKLFRKDDPTTTITFPVKTTNIPNNALLTVELQGVHNGLSNPSSTIVITNNAVLQLNVNTSSLVGTYEFKLSYPGADDVIGTLQVLDKVNLFTVTFNKNGGDTEANPSSIQVQEGVNIGAAMPANPSRTGYSFVGWTTASNGTGTSINESSQFLLDTTVYAKWAITSDTPRIDTVTLIVTVNKTVKNVTSDNSPAIELLKKDPFSMKIVIAGDNLANLDVAITGLSNYKIIDKTGATITFTYTTPDNKDIPVSIIGSIKSGSTVLKNIKFNFVTVNNYN